MFLFLPCPIILWDRIFFGIGEVFLPFTNMSYSKGSCALQLSIYQEHTTSNITRIKLHDQRDY